MPLNHHAFSQVRQAVSNVSRRVEHVALKITPKPLRKPLQAAINVKHKIDKAERHFQQQMLHEWKRSKIFKAIVILVVVCVAVYFMGPAILQYLKTLKMVQMGTMAKNAYGAYQAEQKVVQYKQMRNQAGASDAQVNAELAQAQQVSDQLTPTQIAQLNTPDGHAELAKAFKTNPPVNPPPQDVPPDTVAHLFNDGFSPRTQNGVIRTQNGGMQVAKKSSLLPWLIGGALLLKVAIL